MRGSPLRILFFKTISLLFLFLFITFAHALTDYIPFDWYEGFLDFVNENALLLLLIIIVGMLGELSALLAFPISLGFPLFSGLSAALFVTFLYRIIGPFAPMLPDNIETFMMDNSTAIILVFSGLIFLLGLLKISKDHKPKKEEKEEGIEEKDSLRWSDVGREVRYILYNFAQAVNRLFSSGDKNRSQKKKNPSKPQKRAQAKISAQAI